MKESDDKILVEKDRELQAKYAAVDRGTADILGERRRLSRDEVLGKLGAIDKKALDALLKSLGKKLDKPRVSLLKAELEAHADKRMSPRLWAKEVA